MTERNERIGKSLGYVDGRNNNGLNIVKSVDITDECPKRQGNNRKVILDFMQATEGIMVCVADHYPNENLGSSVANFMRDLNQSLQSDLTANFRYFAEKFGLTGEQLLQIVKREAPPVDCSKLIADFRKYHQTRDENFEYHLRNSGLTLEDLALTQ